MVPVMITIVGGPTVDRTSTGVHETIALSPASVAEEPRGDPAMVESSLHGSALLHQIPRSKRVKTDVVGRLSFGDKASRYDHS